MTSKTELTVGEQIEVEISGVAHGGTMVARHEGRVIFVSDAILGEKVLAEVTETKKKSFARATTISVIEPSKHRRSHVWPEADITRNPADRVGGTEFGHIDLHYQRELKSMVLNDSMKRFGRVETTAEVQAAPGDDDANGLGYRSRVRLHVDAETGVVGPYASRSNRVITTETLPLANEQINLIAPNGEYMPDVQSVDVVAPSADDARSLFSYPGSRERQGANDLVRELVGEIPFLVPAGGFWQVHREAPELLFNAVYEIILKLGKDFDPQAANLDLYGGVGLFGAAILLAGGDSARVTSVEVAPEATDAAAENLSDYVGAMAQTDRVDRYLKMLLKQDSANSRVRSATVVLDPPRSGAGREVTKTLTELAPKNIIYVACDPVALARDTADLLERGYELRQLDAYDLFPHTHHFESIAVFQRP